MSEKTRFKCVMTKQGPRWLRRWKSRHFQAQYVSTREEALQQLLQWVGPDDRGILGRQ